MLKVSEFVAQRHAHLIYDSDKLAVEFREKTGHEACWPSHTPAEMVKMVQERGRGGEVWLDVARQVSGFELAIALATEFVPGYQRTKLGRGFAFDEALDALRIAGF